MKKAITISLVFLLAGSVAVRAKDSDSGVSGQHKTVLSGYEQVPAIYTEGSGAAVAQADETGNGLSVTLSYSGLKGVAKTANLHVGQPGVNGGIVAALCGAEGKPACPAQATDFVVNIKAADVKAVQGIEASAIDALIDALEHGALYVSVSTDKFADGEIRGQFRRGNGEGGDDDNDNGKGKDKEKDKEKGKDKD